MLPIKTILHPTDFSERSGYAFQVACALARDYKARLVILHVALPPVVVYGAGIVPPEPAETNAKLKEKLSHLKAPDASILVEHRLLEGDPVTEIIRTAQEAKSDLVVMGTHGWTGLSRLLMGSVAEGVVRKALCPVLTVKMPLA